MPTLSVDLSWRLSLELDGRITCLPQTIALFRVIHFDTFVLHSCIRVNWKWDWENHKTNWMECRGYVMRVLEEEEDEEEEETRRKNEKGNGKEKG